MTTRAGWATIQLIPSARNWGRMVRKEVTTELRGAGLRAGDDIGAGLVKGIERPSRTAGLTTARNLLDGLSGTLTTGLETVLRGAMVGGPVIAAAAGLAAVVASAVGAAVTTGVLAGLGGGVLAGGIALAVRNPAVKSAWADFGKTALQSLSALGRPLEQPLIRAARTLGGTMRALTPSFAQLGALVAPLVDRLAPALGRMATAVMPGVLAATRASVPMFNAIAAQLPALGAGISRFFATLASVGPEATRVMTGFVRGLAVGLPALAGYLADLTRRFVAIVAVGRQLGGAVAPAMARLSGAVRGLAASAAGADGVLSRLRAYAETLRPPLAALGAVFAEIGAKLGVAWRTQLQPFAAGLGRQLMPLLAEWGVTIRSVLTDLAPVIRGAAAAFSFLWNRLGVGTVVLGTVKSVFSGLVNLVTGTMRIIRGVVTLFAGLLTGDWRRMWSGIQTIGSGIWRLIVGAFQVLIVGRLGSIARGLLSRLGGWFTGTFARIGAAASGWVRGMVARVVSLRASITGAVQGLVARVVSSFSSMMSRAASAVSGGAGRIVGTVRGMASSMLGAVRGLAGSFRAIGANIMGSLAAGIRAGVGQVLAAVRGVTSALPGVAKKALGIASPSKPFRAIGRNLSESTALGVGERAYRATRAASRMVQIPDAARVNVGSVTARAGGDRPSAAPLIGNLTITARESVRDQLDEVTWTLRRVSRGGVYA